MDLPKRKNIRLRDYDYSQNGHYSLTICVKERQYLLWEGYNVGATCGRPQLSNIGQIIDREIQKIPTIYNNISIDKYVIMPNHIHMIVVLHDSGSGRAKLVPTVSRIVQQFKGSISKQVGFSIWQKMFYDHIICNGTEYQKIWEYIDTNPLKWELDIYYRG